MARPICGAKAKSTGKPCRGIPMKNGRCRVHGGASTGPKDTTKLAQNENALKTGEYQTIWFDTLTPIEKNLYNHIDTTIVAQLVEELKLTTIRERRMMERIESLRGADFTVVEQEHEKGIKDDKVTSTRKETSLAVLGQVQEIEDALTRVQDKKAKLLELKHKVESGEGAGDADVSKYVAALGATVKRVWDVKANEQTSED